MNKKNISIISLNFYPENTAIGLYSTQLARFLEQKGANVSVITGFPYYPQWEIDESYKNKPAFLKEKLDGMNIYRYKQYTPKNPTFFKRTIHILDFTWGSFVNIFKIKKCDIVISVVPFTSSAFLGYIHKKRFGAKSWVHIQDFEFDAAFQAGIIQSERQNKSILYRGLMSLESWIYSKADTVSTISNMMLNKLKTKTTVKTYFLPNWIEEDEINPENSAQHPYLTSSKFKILYSGSIGDKQDWSFFFDFIKKLNFDLFEIVIVGDGSGREKLQKKLEGFEGIKLYPPVPYSELSDLLCSADAHFLFQKNEVLDTVMPSKILGMMASAKPFIVTGHPNSEVKKVVEESQGGFYISENDTQIIHEHLNDLRQQPQKSEKMGQNARAYVVKNFAKNHILERFAEQLENL